VAKAVRRSRLDAELVRRGLARSREHASELVAAGKVKVAGAVATKPATGVGADAPIVVNTSETDDPGYASRGARRSAG
jgi:23S rRNA (cytidine1920-2'-O)/16S rRNA (cytidine1409-2'-O)-methyltransferase